MSKKLKGARQVNAGTNDTAPADGQHQEISLRSDRVWWIIAIECLLVNLFFLAINVANTPLAHIFLTAYLIWCNVVLITFTNRLRAIGQPTTIFISQQLWRLWVLIIILIEPGFFLLTVGENLVLIGFVVAIVFFALIGLLLWVCQTLIARLSQH